jgi:hypothetical protein
MALADYGKNIESINGDRRYDRRYGISLDLRWKLVRRRKVLDSGTGSTLDVSSGGILFDAQRQLPVGFNVELSISWPALLHNIAPMQLVVSGRIVRTNGPHAAIRMVQHEFRTMGAPAEQRQSLMAVARTSAMALLPNGMGKVNTLR